jgi:hypothetical protein
MEKQQKYLSESTNRIKSKIFLLISGCMIFWLLFSCDKEKDSINIESVVTRVDIEEMAKMHIPDFYLYNKYLRGITGTEYSFVRYSDSADISITIGLYKSAEIAENIANNFFNNISAGFNEGPHQGVSIGDKFWWFGGSGLDYDNLMGIVFIRKNALFIMGCYYNYGELKTLAKKIDNDIINNADYVELEKTILLPVIYSITATKTVLKEGESAKIIIHAADPNNEPLEYIAYGIGHYEPDPENVFTIRAKSDYIGEPFFGSHIYEFYVINKSNIVSEVAKFEIIISE